jgi:hypothetical protein
MNTIAELKSAFYDAQRHTSNMFEKLVEEVFLLNQKVKELEGNQEVPENPVKAEKKEV